MKVKYKPEIYINKLPIDPNATEAIEIFSETDKHSVTPRTFKSRSLESTESPYYVDQYEYNSNNSNSPSINANNKVTRYGINTKKITVDQQSSTVLGEEIKLATSSGSQTQSSGNSQAKLKVAQSVQHHKLELELLQKAINHLFNEDCRTVLVSILERSIKDGTVQIDNNGQLKTHTVVLYKNPPAPESGKHEVLVIDPNNFEFSNHLSNSNGKLTHELFDKITTAINIKAPQIYGPPKGKTTGPNSDQYRNCTDIAVKLAFGFNKMQEDKIDIKKIGKYPVILAISNKPELNKCIIDPDLVARIKQTSNIEIVKAFYKIEKMVTKNLEVGSITGEKRVCTTTEKHAKMNYTSMFNERLDRLVDQDDLHQENLDTLNIFVQINQDLLKDLYMEQEYLTNLIGEI